MVTKDEVSFDGVGLDNEEKSLSSEDFEGGNFLKNPKLNEELILTVLEVKKSDKISAKNKETGKTFSVGLKQKDGQVKRYDIVCEEGVYTVSNWELYFKLFGSPNGLLMEYAKKNNKFFKGAKVSIKRLVDGSYASTKIEDYAKILGTTIALATAAQEAIKQAIKEQRLFEVKLLN